MGEQPNVSGALINAAASEARRLHQELGLPIEQAARLAVRGALRASGLGQDEVFKTVQTAADAGPLKQIREAVSPWLWITSLVGFGLALLNTRRITKMYQGWRRRPA
jgi:hypothetical protein